MSKPRIPSEFAFQVLALLAAVIVVHAFYVGLIRPSADAQLAAQAALQAQRSVLARDREGGSPLVAPAGGCSSSLATAHPPAE